MKRLLLLFLLLVCSQVHAVTVKPTFWYNTKGLTSYTPANADSQFSTVDAACRNWFDTLYANSQNLVSASVSNSSPTAAGTCYLVMTAKSSGAATNNSQGIQTAFTCPAGFTFNLVNTNYALSTCSASSCPSGFTLNTATNSCEDNCALVKDQVTNLSVNCSSASFPSAVCLPNNCAGSAVSSATAFDKTKNCYFGDVRVKLTGSACNGQALSSNFTNPTAQTNPVDSAETNCIKQGMTYGTVNGVAVCVPKSSAGGTPIKNTTTTTTSTTTTGTTGATNTASTTEVKSATQDGDQITATTTKTNPDGSKIETTSTMPAAEFCSVNPNHQLCKAGEKEEEGADPCEDNPDLPQCLSLGEPSDTDVIGTQTRTVTFSPVEITSGGSCPPDKSLSIAGRPLTFSYSWLCEYASSFKPFMLAFAYLSAAMFLFWGYKGAQT